MKKKPKYSYVAVIQFKHDDLPWEDVCEYWTDEERRKLLNRLRRAEGQIRGVERMVEEDAYCPDIMVQIQAAISALNAFNRELLAAHIRGCVADEIRKGNDAVIDELARLTEKLMK